MNTYGSLHYEYGDAALANLAVLMPLGHATGLPALDAFTPGFELNYRWAQRDTFQGEDYDDSGGSILYLTPSLRVALPREFSFGGRPVPSLRFSLQVPATSRWLHGSQHEDPTWRAGLFVPL